MLSTAPVRVLFVCLGNICRSPMAEGVMLKLLEERGLTDRFIVDSAGTAGYHAGESADRRTLAVLAREKAPVPSLSRRVQDSDFQSFDYILAMDQANFSNLAARKPEHCEAILALALEPVGGGEVPDPYYGGPDGFENVYTLLHGSLSLWIDRMLSA